MAVQSDTSSISYTGNNSAVTTYAVPFVFLENSHLAATAKVTATGVETTVTLTNHTGAGDPNGGTVRTSVAVPATSTLTIFRTVPATQTTTYQEGGDFPAASHERALDKLTFIAQQNARKNDRAIRVTEADGSRNDMVAVANSLVGLDANKQPKAMTLSEVKSYLALTGTTLSVPAGIKTFADAGERGLAVPDFTGQLGTQRDTGRIYISTGTAAGNWSLVDENMSLEDFAAGFFTADATGRSKFASSFVDAALLASNSVETAKINNAAVTTAKINDAAVTTAKINDAAVTTAKINDAAVTPAKLSQPLTLAAAVAATSGTSIDFTGIPSWVKRITVMFAGVSTNGTSTPLIQLGDVGGIETTGYVSTGMQVSTATASSGDSTDGFVIRSILAANAISGIYVFALIDSATNSWSGSGTFKASTVISSLSNGNKSLSDPLTQIRITTANGTDTFDAGSVNIIYEG
jgi:hypothetical protein